MHQPEQDKQAERAAMKKLREDRKPFIKAATAKMQVQKKKIQAIKAQLKDEPQTIPAIAAATGAQQRKHSGMWPVLKNTAKSRKPKKTAATSSTN
jgi:predicted RNA-binding Zn ribbon-like protein